MTEQEKRLAAVELALIETIAAMDDLVVADAIASIRDGLALCAGGEEAEIRLQAIELLQDGQRRFHPLQVGRYVAGDLGRGSGGSNAR